MAIVVGFPRIGKKRELKKALEDFWAQKNDFKELEDISKTLIKEHWNVQKNLEFVNINDFSLYDNMLDLTFALGIIPQRFRNYSELELYFGMARGLKNATACEMTKWFNTNYHYVVPELDSSFNHEINISKIQNEYNTAKDLGFNPKINLIGIFTFVALSKITDNSDFNTIFDKVLIAYLEMLDEIYKLDNNITIQIDEPIFVQGVDERFFNKIQSVYDKITAKNFKIILATYFEHSIEALEILTKTNIHSFNLDFIYGPKNIEAIDTIAKSNKNLYIGIIDGRNIWRSNLEEKLQLCQKIASKIPKNRLFISSSCSLLHSPFSKENETKMDKEILSWQCYAVEKIDEILLLEDVFKNGINENNKAKWEESKTINESRRKSSKIYKKEVQDRLKQDITTKRSEEFIDRISIQRKELGYDDLATTTIGSFPQTPELRALRSKYKKNEISKDVYEKGIKEYIKDCVAFQEEIGLDILVHGEPERNDMVEYFGEQMEGFVFSQNAWVQSYGSRCVKPPIIYGDILRPKAMTLEWSKYAQSLTKKIMKGMLTGPVTILNWSFVRDDLTRKEVCKQIALAIRDEIDDLQNGGIKIIQVDEAAFKEGYPLRVENIAEYENWALLCFKTSTGIAKANTQIHTHMCYSEFDDIIKTIEALDADVISIECARSGNSLLKIFKDIGYTNEIGPGVYDIHSPRIPSVDEITKQINLLLEVLPKEQLWINPDCGLKTRKWEEVKPALKNMVEAVRIVRNK